MRDSNTNMLNNETLDLKFSLCDPAEHHPCKQEASRLDHQGPNQS